MKTSTIRTLLLFGVASLLASRSPAQTQYLLRNEALGSFRPVQGWRGVAEVAAVPDKTELSASGEGRIVVNSSITAPYLFTKQEYVHFEGLLTKKPDGWKILMEYQKSSATEAEWDELK
ncbi:MAG: hypothetical protein K9N23_16895 [Akkermansiaceae bacterium]|nr:hypothetical protein [Akkermansiaceae bacterium]MCF7733370.1 hypothetical protein [Akkermansiaceae bacterium]